MSRKSLFGNVVHAFASDLHFDPLSLVAHQGDMQSLVSVGFRMADPVSQTVGMWLIEFGDADVDVEAVVQFFIFVARGKYNSYSQDIIDLFECDMLGLHFVPDGIG